MQSYFISFLAAANLAAAATRPEISARSGVTARSDTCNIAQAAGLHFIGGDGGGAFCESHWPSADLIKCKILPLIHAWLIHSAITTWSYASTDICGIKVQYASGTTATYGGTGGDGVQQSGHMDLSPGERITSASMAGNGKGALLGKMHLETSGGAKIDFGYSSANMWDIDVGSGFLIGITGHAGSEINDLALMFLAGTVDHIDIGEFKYKQDPASSNQKPLTSSLSQIHFYNNLTQDLPVEFSGGSKVTSTYTISQSSMTTFGGDIKIEASIGVPEIAEASASAEFSWSVQNTNTISKTYTLEVDQGYDLKPTLKPGEGADCHATVANGNGNFAYSTTVTVYMQDGSSFSYPETGNLQAVAFSKTSASCDPNNSKIGPSGYTTGP